MKFDHASHLIGQLNALDPTHPDYATRFVELALDAARAQAVSDLHLQPTPTGLELRWRMDGVLALLGTFPSGVAANVVARLKVLADLLTYRNDAPQEGRIRSPGAAGEMRVSTFPTIHGEKAVVRVFHAGGELRTLAELGLSEEITAALGRLLRETSGALLVTGPAGSGKTTTLYACLRELTVHSAGQRSIVTLEDPVEMTLAGVTQSQVNLLAGFDFASGLRSVLRQDPEVIMVGEIRDRVTAEVALQASLTGQLVLSSFHAGSAAAAVSRLVDMGIEPYVLRSGLLAVISQRLARRLCDCACQIASTGELLGLPVKAALAAVGCPKCQGTGYIGRLVLAEMLLVDRTELGQAILDRRPAAIIEDLAVEAGMTTRWRRAIEAVESGLTSPAEVRRVLGFLDSGGEKAIP